MGLAYNAAFLDFEDFCPTLNTKTTTYFDMHLKL